MMQHKRAPATHCSTLSISGCWYPLGSSGRGLINVLQLAHKGQPVANEIVSGILAMIEVRCCLMIQTLKLRVHRCVLL